MANINKDGQAIGRKGAESRARLLAAAGRLVAALPVERLTASAIARDAGLASQTFYLYFASIDEILLTLSVAAAGDTAEILAELDWPWDDTRVRDHAERFVGAFYRYWDRHRAILNIRNFRADGGQEPFVRVRNDSAMPIVHRIADRIRSAQGKETLPDRDALARAVIVYSAIERMAAHYAVIGTGSAALSGDDLKRAEVDILTLLFSPSARD